MAFKAPHSLTDYALLSMKMIFLMIGGVMAGYTVSHWDQNFLLLMTRPFFQFMVYFFLAASFIGFSLKKRDNLIPIVFSASLFTLIVQGLEFIVGVNPELIESFIIY
jgi:ammonia channel protein AmtB